MKRRREVIQEELKLTARLKFKALQPTTAEKCLDLKTMLLFITKEPPTHPEEQPVFCQKQIGARC